MSDKSYYEYEPATDSNSNKEVEKVFTELEESTAEVSKENTEKLEDVDDAAAEDFIDTYFGKDWDGTFTDLTGFVESYAQDMASQMQYNSSLIEYLNSNKSLMIDDVLRRSGIAQAQNNITLLQNEFNSLTESITNFKTFGYSSGSNDYINLAGKSLDQLENIVNSLSNLQEYAEQITEFLENTPEMVGSIGDYFDERLESISQFLSEDNLSNVLSTFPESVINKFMGLDVVQDFYNLPKQIESSISAIIMTLNSIESPTNLSSALTVIRQLKSIVAEARLAQDQITRCTSIINGLQNNLKSGNYIGFLVSAAGGLKFIEKPSSYAAKYPNNQAYKTSGGHIFETDNTPGKERLHVQHKSGTDIEISPNGDTVVKTKKDFQVVTEENFEIHAKGNQTLIVDKKADIQASILEFNGTDSIRMNSTSSIINSDTLGCISLDFSVFSKGNITLTSAIGTSVSSQGPLFLTSNSMVVIDAPSIIIGKEKCALISLNSTSVINSISGGLISSTASTSNFVNGLGTVRIMGALITLN